MPYDLLGFAVTPEHCGERVLVQVEGGTVAGVLVEAHTQWIGHGTWETRICLDRDGAAEWYTLRRWGKIRFVDHQRGPARGDDPSPLGER